MATAILALLVAGAGSQIKRVMPAAKTAESDGVPTSPTAAAVPPLQIGEGTGGPQIKQSSNRAIEQSPSAPDLLESRPSGATDRPIVVSFDAGASDRGASDILDALRKRQIRTSVFLTGEFIQRFPEIARRIAADDHEVGNHTFNHPHLTRVASGGGQRLRPGITEDFLRDQLTKTAGLYEKTTGRKMAPIWRAPFGEENAEIRSWAARAGYSHVSWTHGEGASLDSLDWVSDEASPRYRSSRSLIDRLLAAARPGGIILMHLGSERHNDPVGREVPRLLDGLAADGYRFAKATEFLDVMSASQRESARH